MVKTKLAGAAGRFGARYGQYVRRRIADIESKQRQKQTCLFCGGRVNRLSKGIWNCRRCSKTFAAHAYFLDKTILKNSEGKPVKKSKPLKKQEISINEEETGKKDTKRKTRKSKK